MCMRCHHVRSHLGVISVLCVCYVASRCDISAMCMLCCISVWCQLLVMCMWCRRVLLHLGVISVLCVCDAIMLCCISVWCQCYVYVMPSCYVASRCDISVMCMWCHHVRSHLDVMSVLCVCDAIMLCCISMFVCFYCFTSHVNSYSHCGTVSSLNHTFSWAGLSKRLTSNLCTYFRL